MNDWGAGDLLDGGRGAAEGLVAAAARRRRGPLHPRRPQAARNEQPPLALRRRFGPAQRLRLPPQKGSFFYRILSFFFGTLFHFGLLWFFYPILLFFLDLFES